MDDDEAHLGKWYLPFSLVSHHQFTAIVNIISISRCPSDLTRAMCCPYSKLGREVHGYSQRSPTTLGWLVKIGGSAMRVGEGVTRNEEEER